MQSISSRLRHRVPLVIAGGVVVAIATATSGALAAAERAGATEATQMAPHAAGPLAAASRSGAAVDLHSSSLGKLLVNGAGSTLFMFTHDRRNRDSCVSIAGCASFWPPLTTAGAPRAGRGVNASLLGTIAISGGRRQVTYAGHALYTYAAESGSGPAQTDYVGASAFDGRWYAVNAAGKSLQ